ncbi:HAD family hydrolase [Actinoplanes aureus]|uniref:HAD family hydrolase n=1 Tax=Actinoplanes aureus TaxID=2792083 RepID=A0A931C4G1_9ACTN|nr:HAD family hydrolase [Actinoplanes aureus]MBG0560273.1 HAD family hydrolase [Actinoplanes aureus]
MILRGVLFDLDGTLGDHDGSVSAALRTWLPSLGVAYSPETHALWDEIAERHLAAWRRREIDFREQRRRRLRDFLPIVGISYAETELDLVFDGFLRAYQSAYRAYDDAFDALAAVSAAGLAVAVLTNGSSEQQRAKLAAMGMAGIGLVYTPEELGVAKPNPASFRQACARWGIAPGEVLSVGDRHEFDVLAARTAGLRAVHLDRQGSGPYDEPHRIRSLRDLAGYL